VRKSRRPHVFLVLTTSLQPLPEEDSCGGLNEARRDDRVVNARAQHACPLPPSRVLRRVISGRAVLAFPGNGMAFAVDDSR